MSEDQAAGENMDELKAKLAKTKRQALTLKARLAEAVAARDAALEELRTLKAAVCLSYSVRPTMNMNATAEPLSEAQSSVFFGP